MSKTALFFRVRAHRQPEWEKISMRTAGRQKTYLIWRLNYCRLICGSCVLRKNDLLDKTEYTQAALVTVSMAAEHVLREWGDDCGRYSGIELRRILRGQHRAGAFSTEDAVLMVRNAGFLWKKPFRNKGAMAAVIGLTGARTEEDWKRFRMYGSQIITVPVSW